MIDVYAMSPINRTAGSVVSQKGCGDGTLTDEQKRENLVARSKQLIEMRKSFPQR